MVDAALRKYDLVAPSGGPAWMIDLVNGDHHGRGSSTPAAAAGYPAITVPAGCVHPRQRRVRGVARRGEDWGRVPAWWEMKVLAVITDPQQLLRILRHLAKTGGALGSPAQSSGI